ncbi:hypothetical protein AAVH_24242 [Aphelenchoides avenae]|nr:hypothetical protein AAVH_24242 [Aphelenchus avenae]
MTTPVSTIPLMSNEVRAKWQEDANKVAKKVIGEVSESVHANTWEKRSKELHPAVTAALDGNLTAKYKEISSEITTFFSVAHLTYDGPGKSCRIHNNHSIYGTHEDVTYLSQPMREGMDRLAANKTALFAREKDILDKTLYV